MLLSILISKRIDIFYREYLLMIKELSLVSKEERMNIYKKYRWMFPKKSNKDVNLEDQFSKRKDYKEKFKDWFYLVSYFVFEKDVFGEVNYEIIQKTFPQKEGCAMASIRYPQKVILALGMLGYLTSIKTNYSNSFHGTRFNVDLLKYNQFDTDLKIEKSIERKDLTLEDCADWRWEDQYKTIMETQVKQQWLEDAQKYIAAYQHYKEQGGKKPCSERDIRLCKTIVRFCANKSSFDAVARHKVDDYGGRFYTLMTNLKKNVRHHCIRIDNERIAEVDVSSAQPTFLGLFIKEKYGADSEWLNHCIDGDFYEWVKKICGSRAKRDNIKKYIMGYLYSYNDEASKTNSSEKTKRLCASRLLGKKLDAYLREKEPIIYTFIQKNKQEPVWDDNKKKWKSILSRELVRMEVKYIKYCISKFPPNFKFYTIHDCICCKRSDADFVRKTMEDCSRELYNLTINLKIENDKDDEPKKAA